ncbi:hypothetical protein C1N32_06370 [Vibrio diazotrophicus]|uniref:DUF1993 domain-containing protein n=1 Tax=Vibrio diazotrophicus TaxID=685 RepID=A0A2J8I5C5_VIBDI|nr:DUF1993 family protein [Vibrio diazotrophicus]PNI05718.1 hypothetical protein C1N32_06370 [Vibrio diazotrophicus]
MTNSIKNLFLGYLEQLKVVVEKVPEELFADSLTEGMFSLEMNAQIAANFLLRGYCPLIGKDVISCTSSQHGKEEVLRLISDVHMLLNEFPEVTELDDSVLLSDSAGFNNINLPQSRFIFSYIVPNYMFHVSMVYAIARKEGVPLSKGDFDGLHSYPNGFSFIR